LHWHDHVANVARTRDDAKGAATCCSHHRNNGCPSRPAVRFDRAVLDGAHDVAGDDADDGATANLDVAEVAIADDARRTDDLEQANVIAINMAIVLELIGAVIGVDVVVRGIAIRVVAGRILDRVAIAFENAMEISVIRISFGDVPA
jgi:hypothetical protein